MSSRREISQEEIDRDAEELVERLLKEGYFDKEVLMQEMLVSGVNDNNADEMLHFSVTRMLAKHFSGLHRELFEEAETLFLKAKVDKTPDISEQDCKPYLNSFNPYIRQRIADLGYFPDILKHDSVAEVRLAVLKKTGVYSEFFCEKEHDIDVIREMIWKGFEIEYLRKSENPEVQEELRHRDQFKHILKQMDGFRSSSVDVLRIVAHSLEALIGQNISDSEFSEIQQALRYLKVSYFNHLENFDE